MITAALCGVAGFVLAAAVAVVVTGRRLTGARRRMADPDARLILAHVSGHPGTTAEGLRQALGMPATRLYAVLDALVDADALAVHTRPGPYGARREYHALDQPHPPREAGRG